MYCEETTPQSICASSDLFGFTLESMGNTLNKCVIIVVFSKLYYIYEFVIIQITFFSETYDEKTPAEIRREKDKERYAAMSVSDKQEKKI